MPALDFWYDFASTYSYLAAERIEPLAVHYGVTIRYRPMLLGPLFAKVGLTTSPFNVNPAKGRNMWRDMERSTRAMNIPFRRPGPFPQHSLLAARIATLAAEGGWVAGFTRAVFRAEFAEGKDISSHEVLSEILLGLGQDAGKVIERGRTDEHVKSRLKATTEDADRRGIFGAPSFTTEDGELFWGNDRLAQAMDWAVDGRVRPFEELGATIS